MWRKAFSVWLWRWRDKRCWYIPPERRCSLWWTEKSAGRREIREETGVRARLYRDVPPVEDVYRLADGRTKKVTYYLARFDGDTLQPDPTQVDGAILLSMDKALATLSHASARKVLRKAAEKVLAIMRE